MTKQEKWQEIANRGIQDRFDPETRAKFDEAVKRGLIKLPIVENEIVNKTKENDSSLIDNVNTGLKTTGVLLSSAVAEPIAGLAGIASTLGAKAGQYFGLTDRDATAVGTDVINTVRDFISFKPDADVQDVLQKVAENPTIKSLSENIQLGQQSTGDFFADIGESIGGKEGRALGGSFGKTLFEGGTMLAGGVIAKGVQKGVGAGVDLGKNTINKTVDKIKSVDSKIENSLPTSSELKKASSDIFESIDQDVKISNKASKRFIDEVNKSFDSTTFDETIAPKSFKLVKNLQDKIESGDNLKISEIDNVKKVLGEVSRDALNKTDASVAQKVSSKIDDFYDSISKEMGSDFKDARNVFRKGIKTEIIEDVLDKADLANAGINKGMQSGFRNILNNKKKAKQFTTDEKDIMKDIVKGGSKSKVLNILSKFDIGEANNIRLMPLLLNGGVAGLGGGVATIALPILGKIASKAIDNIQKGNVNRLKAITAAGNDAREITKAYVKNNKNFDEAELTALFLKPEINLKSLSDVKPLGNKKIEDSVKMATKLRTLAGDKIFVSGSLVKPDINKDDIYRDEDGVLNIPINK
jgi:hypothetical protein